MKNLLIFLIGSVIAGVVGYNIGYSRSKTFYEGLADAEVSAVKKAITNHYEKIISGSPVSGVDKIKTENGLTIKTRKNSRIVVDANEGIDYGKRYRTATESERIPGTPRSEIKILDKEEVDTTKPYIITPEEFRDSEMDCVTLRYFADKVLTDDDYNQINNIGIVGGYVILDQIGIYDSDCLYVRSEKSGIDYEILLDERLFSKVNPILVESN